MPKPKIPAALLVIGVMSLGAPAIAAPLTSLSAAAKPTEQESNLVQVRFGGWHGGGWHGGAGFAAGALAGALVGAAIAAPYYGGGYYPYHSYGYPAYYDDWAPEAYPTYGNNPWNNPYYRWGG
jgi:hypothetical protein